MNVSKDQIEPLLLKVPVAARRIGIAPQTLRQLVRQGRVKSVKVGAREFVSATEVARVTEKGA